MIHWRVSKLIEICNIFQTLKPYLPESRREQWCTIRTNETGLFCGSLFLKRDLWIKKETHKRVFWRYDMRIQIGRWWWSAKSNQRNCDILLTIPCPTQTSSEYSVVNREHWPHLQNRNASLPRHLKMICIHIHMYIYASTRVLIYIYLHTHIYVWINSYAYICMYYTYIYIYVYIYICVYISVHVHK